MKFILLIIMVMTAGAYASDEDLYKFNWLDEDEIVYVLQNKEYPKDNRLGVDFSVYDSASSTYQNTMGFGLSLIYNFSETFSMDVTYKAYNNENNQDLKNLQNQGSGIKPLIRKVETATLVHLNWIPFYGKVNAFNSIIYLDWGVGLGGGSFDTRTNYPTFEDTNVPITYIGESVTGFNAKTYIRFYTSKSFNFGLQYDLSGFNAIIDSQGTEGLIMYDDLSFFIGYLF
jgi:outer membrane beta-barrel protein